MLKAAADDVNDDDIAVMALDVMDEAANCFFNCCSGLLIVVCAHVAVDLRNCKILIILKLNQRNNSHAIALPDIVVGRSPLLRSRVRS